MLFDENIDTYEKTISSVQTIVHEQAHQWFGNLVTPTWWTYTWMKEGFATLFHSFAVDLVSKFIDCTCDFLPKIELS